MQLKLLGKTLQPCIKIMPFKFACSDGQKYPDYKVDQHAMMDLEERKKEDLEESVRSFTVASSPAEKDAMMSSTRMRDII